MLHRHLRVGASALALALASAQLAGAEPFADAGGIETVVVTADRYRATDAASATKTDTPILDTPVAVRVIPDQVLKDQQTLSLTDAVQNVAGVIASNDGYGTSDSFSIRGFDSMSVVYEDGLKLDEYTISGFPVDVAALDRIEVVKGPASVLYGQAEPGGIVSIVTKKPLDAPYLAVQQQAGSFSLVHTTLDASGPLNASRTLLFRFNLDYENAGSFRDFISTHRFSLFPTFEWKAGAHDDVLLELKYGTGSEVVDSGIPLTAAGRPAHVPISSNFADPGLNRGTVDEYAAKLSYAHDIDANWKLRAVYRAAYVRNPEANGQVYLGAADASGNLTLLGLTEHVFRHWTQQGVIDLTGLFDTFGIKHTLVVGADYYHLGGGYAANLYFPPSINIFHPVYNRPYTLPDPATDFRVSQLENAYGGYLQDQMQLPYNIYLLAGFRIDDQTTSDSGYGNAAQRVHDTPPPTPRFGLLWQFVPWASAYASYTENFGSTALGSLTAAGALLPPESAQQFEFGAKADLFDKRLSVTASLYQITKQNIPTADPANPLYVIAVGEARSRGVELDVSGEIAPGWQVIGGYSYIDAVTTKDDSTPSLAGLRFPGVPQQSFSLWSTYRIQDGALRGLDLGGGVQYRSSEVAWESPTGTSYSADRIGGFAVVNAMIGKDVEIDDHTVRVQLNLNNLLDTTYFTSVNPGQAMPGAPFSAIGSVSIRY